MALKKANQEISKKNSKELDNVINDLAIEITVGGDRFDRNDLCFALLNAGCDSSRLPEIKEQVIAKAVTMQPDGQEHVKFFQDSLNYWLDENNFLRCKTSLEYTPKPVPYANQYLSSREADFTTLLERELHNEFCVNKRCEGWVASGDYNAMLFRALPALNEELKIGQSVLKNTDKGYYFDGKPLNEFPISDRLTIAGNALGAQGLLFKVVASDKLKDWNDLNDNDRLDFTSKAWNMMNTIGSPQRRTIGSTMRIIFIWLFSNLSGPILWPLYAAILFFLPSLIVLTEESV